MEQLFLPRREQYIHWVKRNLCAAVSCILLGLTTAAAFGEKTPATLGVEATYGYVFSSNELSPASPHGVLASLYYGYVIKDSAKSSSLLSLAIGYGWFPTVSGGNALNGLVYGLEYEHVFFRQNRIALAVDYGLLFNLIFEGGREGYAFGHHTRLGAGPVFALGEKDQLLVNVAYNMVTFPYFELASTRMSYLSLGLRYQRRI